jgi:hypothetical protein
LDLLKKIYSNLLDNIDLPVLSRSGVIFWSLVFFVLILVVTIIKPRLGISYPN